ncbi:BatA domain-containing protein [Microvirga sp. STR05]|uniref:BatA domain-containing protein n=1 Tax=Hymenobacter duratus TaxID=2771356 RepID=A0ABR8JPU0_9BACT|nr:BatA domain-containing protein [Hymenobacter duratus]MBD2716559.1 BatA domain-containing protein [Hymenobacter duratus]MBR7951474.1 BatA domain-containing protein [Microvirga sp. STR05]
MALVYPWFLLGLLGIAIPVVIHLFELRRPKRLLFTNVGFIKEVRLITARQRKLKHLLILFTRICFVVFLTLMFVQPYIKAPEHTSRRQITGILVDSSPSMQAGVNGEQSYFDQAVAQARELPNAYSAAAQFVLAQEAGSPMNSAVFRAELDKLQVSGQRSEMDNMVRRLGTSNQKPGEIFVFSDFQKNAFSTQSLRAMDSAQQVFLVPVGGNATRNAFVDSVWLDDAFVRMNADILLHVRLRNGGTEAIENCQVKLFVGQRQAATFSVDMPAKMPVSVTARVRLASAASEQCRVELEDYPVSFDNSYYFSLQPSPKVQVVDITGPQTPPTQQLYSNEPLFAYSWATAGSLNYQVAEAANLLLVQGQSQITAGLRESLRRVVQRGGSVAIVPTDNAQGRASYDQLFRDLGIGPVQWEDVASKPALRSVAVPERRNPFFRDVFGVQSRQPVMPKAAPVLRWSRSGNEILRLQDGDGFLGAFASGKGTVYLFSTPFDEARTDFAQHALFVPVMYRLAMQSYQREQQPAYRLNQGTVVVPIDADPSQGEQVFKLTKDSLTFIPSQRLQAGTLRFEVPAAMREPGFYTLLRGNQPVATLAFNNDKKESELAAYSADELRQLIGPNRKNVQVYDASAGESVAARYKAERVGTPLWQYCLWAALACLLAEVLLLRFMNRPKTAEPVAMAA